MKNQYVILTGGKNNSGDHLIKLRAKELIQLFKPDVEIIDLNGWETINDDSLELINESKALLLVGGPALQRDMVPNVYGLPDELDKIKVPIGTMGIGWYSKKGDWDETHNYPLSKRTIALLDRIENSGIKSSVRDYHTLNVLQSLGYRNFLMTGCPALYVKSCIGKPIDVPKEIEKIGFSLGVTGKSSRKMLDQMKQVLLITKKLFPNAEITTVFHHSPDRSYLSTPNASKDLYDFHYHYKNWLEEHKFSYIDISGGVQKMLEYYSSIDFHIGYRVHAHILMSSWSKPSILLSEDGRGKALSKVLNGIVLDSYQKVNDNLIYKALNKLKLGIDSHLPSVNLVSDLDNIITYELKNGIRFAQPRQEIDMHFGIMSRFVQQLP